MRKCVQTFDWYCTQPVALQEVKKLNISFFFNVFLVIMIERKEELDSYWAVIVTVTGENKTTLKLHQLEIWRKDVTILSQTVCVFYMKALCVFFSLSHTNTHTHLNCTRLQTGINDCNLLFKDAAAKKFERKFGKLSGGGVMSSSFTKTTFNSATKLLLIPAPV